MQMFLFFMAYVITVSAEKHLLHSVTGDVAGGNYTYYSLMYDGPISLYLFSKLGDADLYISQIVTKPTFEPDSYCLQSSTCGLDIIHIPRNFRRPIGIGVYGHPSHELSSYLLEVFYRYNDDLFDPLYDSDGEYDEDSKKSLPNINPIINKKRRNDRIDDYDGHDDEEESFIWALIWSFIDILLEVLFL